VSTHQFRGASVVPPDATHSSASALVVNFSPMSPYVSHMCFTMRSTPLSIPESPWNGARPLHARKIGQVKGTSPERKHPRKRYEMPPRKHARESA